MSNTQKIFLAVLAVIMIAVAMALGNWSERINPDGIEPHPVAAGETAIEPVTPRDAYSFGISIGLLATALAYCCLAFGLLIQAKSKGRPASRFTYWVAGLAGVGFALSYLLDDYFY
ncbi:MAG: hypothetical protein AB8B87_17505 [Granulosicoccus sp.]